uniref:Putative immunoglobulin superfamily protein n=1 Tax=Xenopsylla cheopis TaxID=163159 RepID=A0A6M2DZ54_XENCH
MAWSVSVLVSTLLIITGVSGVLDCPDSCDCNNAPDSLIEANCTDLNKLQKFLNSEKSLSIDILKLSDLRITTINGQLDKLTGLSALDLSSNNLQSVKKLPKTIIKLDLSNNFLKTVEDLPRTVRELNLRGNKLKELPYSITSLTHLRRLFLENNTLSCSCETIQVRDWLNNRYISTDKPECLIEQGKKMPLSDVKIADVCMKIKKIELDDDMMQGDDPLGGSVFQGSGSEPDDDEDLFITVSTKSPIQPNHNEEPYSYEGSGGSDFDFTDQAETYEKDNNESSTSSSETKPTTDHILHKPKPTPIDDTESDYELGSGSGSGSGSGDGGIPPIDDTDDSYDFDAFFASESPTTSETVTSNSFFDWDPFGWFSGTSTTEDISDASPEINLDEEKQEDPTTEVLVTEAPIIPKVDRKLDAEVIKPEEKEEESENDSDQKVELGNIKTEKDEDSTTTYACLGVLSVLLLLLIIFVIVKKRKTDQRRKRQQKRDVESRGTEMRDMNKTLIDKNIIKPKVNGKYESVPLVTNGDKKPAAIPKIIPNTVDTKPALEKLMDKPTADAIETYDNVPSPKNVGPVASTPKQDSTINDHENVANDYKVKIKLKENPESVPKTPVLVTRTRSNAGDIILTPVNKNGLNGNTGR